MTDDLLTHFGRWFASNSQWMTEQHLVSCLSEPSRTDKPGRYADIDGTKITGRVTLWTSGECDTEAVWLASGDRLFWEHERVASAAELDAALHRFVRGLLNGAV